MGTIRVLRYGGKAGNAEGHVRAAEKASGLQTRSSTMEGDQVQVWR